MAESVSAIDDAIAHLDALISRFRASPAPAYAQPRKMKTKELLKGEEAHLDSEQVQCNKCLKWRAMPEGCADAVVGDWTCNMKPFGRDCNTPEAEPAQEIHTVGPTDEGTAAKAKPRNKEDGDEVKKAIRSDNNKDMESPIPDILGGRKLKLPGVPAAKSSIVGGNEHADNFDKALLQVALVQSVSDHSNSEKLYVCKVEVGGGNVKQVVAGLKKFVKVEELEGKKVCVILNLKPAKLAGQLSEAMILAGSIATQDGSELVKVLEPPFEALPGDRIFFEGGAPSASPAKQLSSKIWEKIVPLLKVEGGLAVFDSKSIVTSAGSIRVPGLPDGAGIH